MISTVLVVVGIDSHFVELSRVSRLLKQSGRFKPVLCFLHHYAALERDLDYCRAEGWDCVPPPLPSEVNVRIKRGGRSLSKAVPAQLRATLFFFPLVFRRFLVYRRQESQMRSFLEAYKPDLLIMAEDSIDYGLYIIIKAGKSVGIPTVIVPFTIANASEPAETFFHNPDHIVSKSIINRLVASLCPRWVYCYKGRKLLRLPVYDIVALELSGLAPRRPWTYNSEETSVIATENEYMLQYYQKEGLPAERLVLTGALSDDVLARGVLDAETLRTNFYRDLDLPERRRMLLCALPPSQFPRECEFQNYEELLRFWCDCLNELQEWNVIVRPHPRIATQEVESLKQFGIIITQKDTASLIPLCDLYVASVSATIRWAIACGKPVVNYDVYRFGYSDYKDSRGVTTVNSKEAFVSALRRLTKDNEYYSQIVALQRKCMASWGTLDGKSGERILRLFDDVIEKRTRSL